jgi:hypothetical protein
VHFSLYCVGTPDRYHKAPCNVRTYIYIYCNNILRYSCVYAPCVNNMQFGILISDDRTRWLCAPYRVHTVTVSG